MTNEEINQGQISRGEAAVAAAADEMLDAFLAVGLTPALTDTTVPGNENFPSIARYTLTVKENKWFSVELNYGTAGRDWADWIRRMGGGPKLRTLEYGAEVAAMVRDGVNPYDAPEGYRAVVPERPTPPPAPKPPVRPAKKHRW